MTGKDKQRLVGMMKNATTNLSDGTRMTRYNFVYAVRGRYFLGDTWLGVYRSRNSTKLRYHGALVAFGKACYCRGNAIDDDYCNFLKEAVLKRLTPDMSVRQMAGIIQFASFEMREAWVEDAVRRWESGEFILTDKGLLTSG